MFQPFIMLSKKESKVNSRRIGEEDIYPGVKELRKTASKELKSFLGKAEIEVYTVKDANEKIIRSDKEKIKNAIFVYAIQSPQFVEPYKVYAAIRIRDGEMFPERDIYFQVPDGRVYKEKIEKFAAKRVRAAKKERKSVFARFLQRRAQVKKTKMLPPERVEKTTFKNYERGIPSEMKTELEKHPDLRPKSKKVEELINKVRETQTSLAAVNSMASDMKKTIDERFKGAQDTLKKEESRIIDEIIANKRIVDKVCYDLGEKLAMIDRAAVIRTRGIKPSSETILAEIVKKFDADGEISVYIEKLQTKLSGILPYEGAKISVAPKTQEMLEQEKTRGASRFKLSQMQDSTFDDLLTVRSLLQALAASIGEAKVQVDKVAEEIGEEGVPTVPLQLGDEEAVPEYAYAKKVVSIWSEGKIDDKTALEFFEGKKK